MIPQSKLATRARSVDGAWTPWINAGWADGSTYIHVKFRVWISRRGRGVHVETHAESDYMPGQTRLARASRPGMYELRRAGEALAKMARWDPTRPPNHPRAVWNKDAKDFTQAQALAQTVALGIPALLDPKRGRPRTHAVASSSVDPALPIGLRGGGRVAARRARRMELLNMTERITHQTMPILERLQDARRMGGYNITEQARIGTLVRSIVATVHELHTEVFYDRVGTPVVDVTARRERVAAQPLADLDGFTVELVDMPTPTDPTTVQPTP